MSFAFVEQLAGLARSHPYQNKWVVVPTQEVGWTLAERLLLEGHNWLNFRFQTPLQLALEAAGPVLWERGLEACPKGLGPGCLHGLGEHPYSSLMSQPGMDQELWSRLRRSRLEGERWEPFDGLFQELLRSRGWADKAMVFECPAATRVTADDVLIVYPMELPLLIRAFLERLPGERREVMPFRVAEGSRDFFCAGRRDLEFEEIVARLEGPTDQVEVIIHRADAPLLHEILCQYEIPATFSCGLPLHLSRPGQALRDFVDWLVDGVSGNRFRELLMSNFIVAPPNSWVAARLLAAAGVRWGREDYSARLEFLQNRCLSQKHDWLELQAGQVGQLRDWFERLFERFPLHSDGTASLSTWTRGLVYCVRELLDAHDAEATEVLLKMLEDFAQIPDQLWPLEQLRHHLLHRLQNLVWRSSRPRPGHLHVTTLDALGLSGRPVTFLTGQEEGMEEVPGLPPLGGHLTFSYSTRCRDGERPQSPNRLFLEEYGAGWQPEPVDPIEVEPPEGDFPDLVRGEQARRCRESARFSEYDGHVPEAQLPAPTSVSGLQTLAACPFQFFLSRGLKIYPEPLPEPSRDRWIDPMEQGHILHEMFAGWVEGKGSPAELMELSLRRQPPPPNDWLGAQQRQRLLEHFEYFLTLEPQPGQSRCEVPFEVTLRLEGLEIALRGCIDRLDETRDGLRVVDYKTGRTFHLGEGRHFQGRHIQHDLYALAAEALLNRPVVESGYLHTHPDSQKTWTSFEPPDRAELSATIKRVLQPLHDGTFVQSHRSQEDCRYCHFQAACVGRRTQDLKKKLAAPELRERIDLLESP